MGKIYIYSEDLINEIDVNGKSKYISDLTKIEDNSTVFYVPSKIENYYSEKDYIEELNNKDDKTKYLKYNYIFFNFYKKYNYYSVIEIENNIHKILIEGKKNINIINIEEVILSKVDTSKCHKTEWLDNIFVYKLDDGDNLLLNFVYEGNFILNSIKKIGDIELINYLLDVKRKKEKIQKKVFLNIDFDNEDLKKVFIEDQKEYEDNIQNEEIRKIIPKSIFYNKIKQIKFLDKNFKSKEMELGVQVYNKIKSKQRKEIILLGINIVITGFILFYLFGNYKDNILSSFISENNNLESKVSQLKNSLKEEGSNKINDKILKMNKEWKNAPLVIKYIEKIGLKINSSKILKKEDNYYIQIITIGNIPKSIKKYLTKNVQMVSITNIPNDGEFKNGNVNSLIFDLKEIDKNVFKMEVK